MPIESGDIMNSQDETRKDLIGRIEALVEESSSLVRTKASWHRHVEIQAEIMSLCRLAADMFSGPQPYWQNDEGQSNQDVTSTDKEDKSEAA